MKILMKVLLSMSLVTGNTHTKTDNFFPLETPTITSMTEVIALFPKTVDEIRQHSHDTLSKVKEQLVMLIETSREEITYENTLRAFDMIMDMFKRTTQVLETMLMLSPYENLRLAAQEELIKLHEASIDLFSHNKELYQIIAYHAQTKAMTEKLPEEERYFEKETLEEFMRNGLSLPNEERHLIIALQKELATLYTQFDKNINDDTSSITVATEELEGIDQEFIATLKKIDDGKVVLGVDYPTYYKILRQCHNQETRKKLHDAYSNRAYPSNIDILEKIINKRNELAQRLGFTSYAHLNIISEMAKTPEVVEQFLYDLLSKATKKEALEFDEIKKELPPSVALTAEGKMQPWDKLYIDESIKRKKYTIDEYKIAEYFPMEKTIDGLLAIYETFFSLTFKRVALPGLWHEEVMGLEVYRQETLLGYILLDLYPRDYKYKHACQITIVPALLSKENTPKPAVVIVVANFPRSTPNKPSLLLRSDVRTFFHEFGHALHAILGATRLASQSGTHVKHDFVEMPSQMLEEWLFDKDILYNLSHHYLTGEKLSSTTLNTLAELKNFNSGAWVTRQLFLSLLCLEYFKQGENKDTQAIMQTVHEKTRIYDQYDPNDHLQAAFGHLTQYAARYYGYLWSKVFALDLFDTIKKHGLLNPTIGEHYSNTVLSKGGTKDPNILLFDFLGRQPNHDAFFRDLGL